MSGKDRVNIFPSRANLVIMKNRMLAATKGLNMLKRKRDALEVKIREMRAEIDKTDHKVNIAMHEAINAIALARYLGTDFNPAKIINPERADVTLRTKYSRVVGVLLPALTLLIRPVSSFPLTGLSRGGRQVEIVREKYLEALKELINKASLQYSERTFNNALRQTNMRVNAIDYVILPKYENTINYIRDELDEYEREDFYRLKRSQAKQKKNKQKYLELVKKFQGERESKTLELQDVVDSNKENGVDYLDTKYDELFAEGSDIRVDNLVQKDSQDGE